MDFSSPMDLFRDEGAEVLSSERDEAGTAGYEYGSTYPFTDMGSGAHVLPSILQHSVPRGTDSGWNDPIFEVRPINEYYLPHDAVPQSNPELSQVRPLTNEEEEFIKSWVRLNQKLFVTDKEVDALSTLFNAPSHLVRNYVVGSVMASGKVTKGYTYRKDRISCSYSLEEANQHLPQDKLDMVNKYVLSLQKRGPSNEGRGGVNLGPFKCTFGCGYLTKRASDWRHHEESHEPQELWLCHFCLEEKEPNPFIVNRREDFLSHVETHQENLDPKEALEMSKVDFRPNIQTQCPFCFESLESWDERCKHIVSHFDDAPNLSSMIKQCGARSSSAAKHTESSLNNGDDDSDNSSLKDYSLDDSKGNTKTKNFIEGSLETTWSSTDISETTLKISPVGNFEVSDIPLTRPVSPSSLSGHIEASTDLSNTTLSPPPAVKSEVSDTPLIRPASPSSLSERLDIDGILGSVASDLVSTMIWGLLERTIPMLTSAWISLGAPTSSGHPDQQSSSSSAPPLTTGSIGQSSPKKRTRDDDGDPGDDEENDSKGDDDDRRRKKRGKGPIDREPHLGLRCPFYVRDPERYAQIQACSSGKGFANMSRLRTHLKRDHTQPLRCGRCWIDMKSKNDFKLHIRSERPCELRDEPADDRLAPEDWERITSKAVICRQTNVEEKWKLLFKAIFPGDRKVPPPFDKMVTLSRIEEVLSEVLEEELQKELSHFIPSILDGIKDRISLIIEACKARLQQPRTGMSENAKAQSTGSGSSAGGDPNAPPTPLAVSEKGTPSTETSTLRLQDPGPCIISFRSGGTVPGDTPSPLGDTSVGWGLLLENSLLAFEDPQLGANTSNMFDSTPTKSLTAEDQPWRYEAAPFPHTRSSEQTNENEGIEMMDESWMTADFRDLLEQGEEDFTTGTGPNIT